MFRFYANHPYLALKVRTETRGIQQARNLQNGMELLAIHQPLFAQAIEAAYADILRGQSQNIVSTEDVRSYLEVQARVSSPLRKVRVM